MKRRIFYFAIIFATFLLNCDLLFNDQSDENELLKKALKQAKINALKIEISRSIPPTSDSLQIELYKTIKEPWAAVTIPDTMTVAFNLESLSKKRVVVENDTTVYYKYVASRSRSGPHYYITGSFKDIEDIQPGSYQWFFYILLTGKLYDKYPIYYVYLFDIE